MKKILILLGGFITSVYLVSLFYIGINLSIDSAKPSDAILILGAKSQYKNKVNPCLLARVEKGVALYKSNYAPKIIMSGGNDGYDRDNQAKLMKTLAQEKGVPTDAIFLENKSSSTYENLLFTKKIMDTQHVKSIIIVSDPYHLPRAALLAKTLHISYTVSPAIESPCWSSYTFLSFDYFRDGVALLQYIATGKISLLTR